MPALRFPEFLAYKPWETESLGNKTIKVGSGITPSGGEENYLATGRPFVRSQNVGWGRLILEDVVFIDDATHRTFVSTEIRSGDVLLNITGASIGRSAIADQRIDGGNVNQHVCIVRTKQLELSSLYLNQYLLSEGGQKQIDSYQAGGNRQGLNFAQIRSFLVPCTSLPEQKRVADCLSSLDDLIAAQAKKIEALKVHKKGLMQQLFPAEGETVPRLRFPGFQGTSTGWQEKKLRSVCAKIMDGTHFSPKSKTGPRMYLTSKNIQNGVIDLSNLSFISEEDHQQIYAKCPVTKNDVLLTKDGANTGNCALNTIDFEFSLLSSVAVLRGIKAVLDQRFLYQAILSDSFQRNIRESMSGQAITRITLEKIGAFKIAIPCIEEQYIVADCLSSLDDLIAAQTQKLKSLKAQKTGLMQGLFPSLNEAEA